MNLKETVRMKISEICIRASVIFRRVTSLDRVRRVIWLQTATVFG